MIGVLCAVAYILVGSVIGTVTEHIRGPTPHDDPTAFFMGLFWPILIPVAITVTLTKRVLHRVDRWREAREKERVELSQHLAELEAELREKGVFDNRRTD